MRRISCWSSVCTQVARTPSVVPLSGSTAISGTGMKGAVAGLSQFVHPARAGASGVTLGAGAGLLAGSSWADAGVGAGASTAAIAQGRKFSAILARNGRRGAREKADRQSQRPRAAARFVIDARPARSREQPRNALEQPVDIGRDQVTHDRDPK